MSARDKNKHWRQRIAYEAARLMMEEGVGDHERARRKTAGRLGAHNQHLWPSIADIHAALEQQQRLFQPRQHETLDKLRQCAKQAMQAFSLFRPRLVGSVLDGTADPHSRVMLYLFSDCADDIVHALMEQGIPWEERQRLLRYAGGERKAHPVFRFIAGDIPVELMALPSMALRNPPLSPVTDKPDRGASAAQLDKLLDSAPLNHCCLREIGT